jgi:hypothetical protein
MKWFFYVSSYNCVLRVAQRTSPAVSLHSGCYNYLTIQPIQYLDPPILQPISYICHTLAIINTPALRAETAPENPVKSLKKIRISNKPPLLYSRSEARTIGHVIDVRLVYEQAKDAVLAPVHYEVELQRIASTGAAFPQVVASLIRRGLRAPLQSAARTLDNGWWRSSSRRTRHPREWPSRAQNLSCPRRSQVVDNRGLVSLSSALMRNDAATAL